MTALAFLASGERGHVSIYAIESFERALSAAGIPHVRNHAIPGIAFVAKVLAKGTLLRSFARIGDAVYFVPIMGPCEYRLFPASYVAETIVYCFDCWPPEYGRWERLFRNHRMKVAFFSARQSAYYFARRMPGMTAVWMPEAVDAREYRAAGPLRVREIDVLELGRHYDAYHVAIRDHCMRSGYIHKFEKTRGRIIFPTRRELVTGLADSKISVCFPSSVTHPDRSGDVETVTHRYLESIASRCILLGRCPAELHDLFGYSPVVEADLTRPTAQLDAMLRDVDAYSGLIERNYERLWEVGTWDIRVRQILDFLAQAGYRHAG